LVFIKWLFGPSASKLIKYTDFNIKILIELYFICIQQSKKKHCCVRTYKKLPSIKHRKSTHFGLQPALCQPDPLDNY
jgi:hypothetical protein